MNPDSILRSLHACYCQLTQHAPPYRTCERRLLEFHNAGFTCDELKLVVDLIKSLNRKQEFKFHISLRFDKLIGDMERFGDLLGQARADERRRAERAKYSYPPNKAEVLRATGRPDAPEKPVNCVSAAEVFARMKEAALGEAAETLKTKP